MACVHNYPSMAQRRSGEWLTTQIGDTLTFVKGADQVEVQNITLAIPKELLRKAKILAAERRTSISALLARALQELVQREETYDRARQRHLTLLEQGFDLGTAGTPGWQREGLHER